MATFDCGRQRYSMNFYASHQRPLQRRSYTGRPSRPAEGELRVKTGNALNEHMFSALVGSGHVDGRTCGLRPRRCR
jgi:hypothetical protein